MRLLISIFVIAASLLAQSGGSIDPELHRRVVYANQHFAVSGMLGSETDRGLMYIRYGAPDGMERSSDGRGLPVEHWHYRRLEGLGDNIFADFVDVHENGEYILTTT
jgi:hypothetical protein